VITPGSAWHPGAIPFHPLSQVVAVEFVETATAEFQLPTGRLGVETTRAKLRKEMPDQWKPTAVLELIFSSAEGNRIPGSALSDFSGTPPPQSPPALRCPPTGTQEHDTRRELRFGRSSRVGSTPVGEHPRTPTDASPVLLARPVLLTTRCPVLLTTACPVLLAPRHPNLCVGIAFLRATVSTPSSKSNPGKGPDALAPPGCANGLTFPVFRP
jgi:hypothetical protein